MLEKRQNTKIILIPYAEKQGANTGVNISKASDRQTLYMKNCCVSACSAKHNNENCDVAIVTNIDFPEIYVRILENNDVSIIKVPFDMFYFSESYTWSLAFYKLCAIYRVVRQFDYEAYAYLDADVYVQSSFDAIWSECDQNIMLYDISHGLQVRDYRIFVDEVSSFLGKEILVTHYGGEFFAANRENALKFSAVCREIYEEMVEESFETTKGDEFIVSLAALQLREQVKNASAYIYRFWTGSFRLVSTCYEFNAVTIIHVPDEKERGIIKLFDRYLRKNKIPSNSAVYRTLHLLKPSLRTMVISKVKRLIKVVGR